MSEPLALSDRLARSHSTLSQKRAGGGVWQSGELRASIAGVGVPLFRGLETYGGARPKSPNSN